MTERLWDIFGELARGVFALALYCAIIAGAGYAVWQAIAHLPQPEAAAPQASAWHESEGAARLLSLDLSDFIAGSPRHIVRRHQTGGGRRDLIVWGHVGERGPAFALEIYRPGTEAEVAADPLAAFAVRLGGAAGAADPAPLKSKFGDFALTRAQERGERGRLCVGFVRLGDDAQMRISGLYCDQVAQTRAAETVACALDRLGLSSAGGDGKLAGLFARAQLLQSTCAPGRMPFASVPRRDAWMDVPDGSGLRTAGR